MRLNRHAVGVFAASATLLVGGGAALAASADGGRGGVCEQRLAKIAENRGVSGEQLKADVKARLLARIDAAEKAGRSRPSCAQRCASASRRKPLRRTQSRQGADRRSFAAQGGGRLPRPRPRAASRSAAGHLARGLAEKQGKSVSALEAAMVAPARLVWPRRRGQEARKTARTRSSRSSSKVPSGSRRTSSPRSSRRARSNDDEAREASSPFLGNS
jgi:hypothetical protein